MTQPRLFGHDPAPKRRTIGGAEGEALRAFDVHHRRNIQGRGYLMHGGDLAAATRLVEAGYTRAQLDALMSLYFDRMEEKRGTDDARFWPARFTSFASRVSDLIPMTDPDTDRPLTWAAAREINRAGFSGYMCGLQGAGRESNPHEAATRTWARWDRGWITGARRIATK